MRVRLRRYDISKALQSFSEPVRKALSILCFIPAFYGFGGFTIGIVLVIFNLINVRNTEFRYLVKVLSISILLAVFPFLLGSALWGWSRRRILLGVILVLLSCEDFVGFMGTMMMVGFDFRPAISGIARSQYFEAITFLASAIICLPIGVLLIVQQKRIDLSLSGPTSTHDTQSLC
jgi:hypothetical protein